MYKPEGDGITHINISIYGKTELGKMLSNFYNSNTKIEFDNDELEFKNLESFLCFLYLYKHDKIKRFNFLTTNGIDARKEAFQLIDELNIDIDKIMSLKSTKSIFSDAIKGKIKQNKKILSLLAMSELPFSSYYIRGDKVISNDIDWQLDLFNELRDLLHKKLKLFKYKAEN